MAPSSHISAAKTYCHPHNDAYLIGNTELLSRSKRAAPEWDFIRQFFLLNDFAGILLYQDLLPEETVAGFHARFGEPSAETSVRPGPGRIQFIPKKSSWRRLVDRSKGLSLKLSRPVFP